MKVEDLAESRMNGELLEKSFTIGSPTSLEVEVMAEGGAEVDEQSNSLQSAFTSRSQNGTIHHRRKNLDVSESASDSSSYNVGVPSEADGGASVHLDCSSRDREIVKGITHSDSYKKNNKIHPENSPDYSARSGESNLFKSSEAGLIMVEDPNAGYMKEAAESESGAKTFEDKAFGNESRTKEEERRASSRTISPARTDDESENLLDKLVFEGRGSGGSCMSGNHRDNFNVVGDVNFDSPQAGGCLEDTPTEANRSGEKTHRNSDTGVSFDCRFTDKTFGNAARQDEHHHRRSRGSGAGVPNPALVERLYNPPHVCNHARCAANNPDYAVKQETPTKKYLVAKKHAYGGVVDRARRRSCDHERGASVERGRTCSCERNGGSAEKVRRASCGHVGVTSGKVRTPSGGGSVVKPRRASCDRDKSHALHVVNKTEPNGDKPRKNADDGDKSNGINTPAGKTRRSSVDSDRNQAQPSTSVPRHRRGKSTPIGFAPQGPWNSSVALDKKKGDRGFWSSVIVEKKHGNQGGWNSSVALDKSYCYGPWNGSVAIGGKSGEKKEKLLNSLLGAEKRNSGCDVHTCRRTSTETMEDRRQKPRRSSIASDLSEAAAEATNSRRLAGGALETSGNATPGVSLSEGGRSPPRTTTGYEGSPSASVGSNHSGNSCSKDTASWKRRQSSPGSSCTTGGDSPSCDSFSSFTRGSDSKADSKARYEQHTVSSKLPRFPSSYSPPQYLSASVNGRLPGFKPSWNSATTKVSSVSVSLAPVASGANTSSLSKNFLAKLKESTKATTPPAPTKALALPSWNSSITVAPNLFDYSKNGSPALKMTRKTERKQSNRARKSAKVAEEQWDETPKGENPTPPKEDTVSIPPEESIATVLEEMIVPIPESSAEKHIDPGSVVSVPSTASSNLTRYGSMSDSATSTSTPAKLSKTPSIKETEKENKVAATLKFGKKGRTIWLEEARKKEAISLKKNETPERRLSEEYMTDHTLTTIKRDIQGGRVKSLVHAFESLKTGPDAEHHHSADETVRSEYERELAAELAALPPSASPTAA